MKKILIIALLILGCEKDSPAESSVHPIAGVWYPYSHISHFIAYDCSTVPTFIDTSYADTSYSIMETCDVHDWGYYIFNADKTFEAPGCDNWHGERTFSGEWTIENNNINLNFNNCTSDEGGCYNFEPSEIPASYSIDGELLSLDMPVPPISEDCHVQDTIDGEEVIYGGTRWYTMILIKQP